MNTRLETTVFIVLTLLVSWAIGAAWLMDERRFILLQVLMCVPAIVGFGCAYFFRKEPPRAVGLQFTGWTPWLAATLYPLGMIACALAFGYALRLLTGRPDLIVYQPDQLRAGHSSATGWSVVGMRSFYLVLGLLPWLLVAAAYRWNWPERVKSRLPSSIRWLHHVFRALLWLPTFWVHQLPGNLGEELGWRGFWVRRWIDRPLIALALTAPVWAAFHLPIVFSSTQRGHWGMNIVFLLSIAAAASVFAAFYRWTGRVWPCAVLHMYWNSFNPLFLGDVYAGRPALFGGEVWLFNGEGLFGLLFHGAITAFLITRWKRAGREAPVATPTS